MLDGRGNAGLAGEPLPRDGDAASSGASIFSATYRWRLGSNALNTTPIAPRPSNWYSSYSPNWHPVAGKFAANSGRNSGRLWPVEVPPSAGLLDGGWRAGTGGVRTVAPTTMVPLNFLRLFSTVRFTSSAAPAARTAAKSGHCPMSWFSTEANDSIFGTTRWRNSISAGRGNPNCVSAALSNRARRTGF